MSVMTRRFIADMTKEASRVRVGRLRRPRDLSIAKIKFFL